MIWPYVTIGSTTVVAIITWFIQNIPPQFKIAVTVLILIAVVGQVFTLRVQHQEKQLSRYFGTLKGPVVTVLSPRQEVYPKLKLGDSNTFIVWQGHGSEPLLRFLKDNELIIWVEEGKLKISTKIRDSDGKLITEIIGNDWILKREALWDRNYNENALEVKNGEGDVILQVFMKEDYIQFAAKMYGRNGEGFAIGSARFREEDLTRHTEGKLKVVAAKDGPKEVKVGDVVAVMERRPPGCPLELYIEPIFKYPSKQHFHELLSE